MVDDIEIIAVQERLIDSLEAGVPANLRRSDSRVIDGLDLTIIE